jgi:hypothetical protein
MKNVNSNEAWRRAAALYHLGMRVTADAKKVEKLTPNQTRVVSIFLHEVKASHKRARKEAGL